MTAPAGASVAIGDELASTTEQMDSAVEAGEIDFENQTTTGQNVTVSEVNLTKGGFVGIVYQGTLIGVSEYLGPGEHADITIELDDPLVGIPGATANLTAVALRDGNGNQQYDGPTDPTHCLMLTNGQPIEDSAVVSIGGPGNANFQITSLNAPTVTQGQTANITATIENVGNAAGTQNVTYQLSGQNLTTGTGAVDIVFVLDQSSSMTDDNEVMRRNLVNFTNALEEQGIDARYAVISMERPATVTQDFTSDVNETQRAIDDIVARSGDTEDNFEALGMANQLLNQEGRPGAARFIIDVTDEGSNVDTPSQQELSDTFNQTNTTYLAVTPNATTPPMNQYPESLHKRPLANMTESGEWYDLVAGDFGQKFVEEMTRDIGNFSEADQEPLTLNASETGQKTFTVNTTNMPSGTYDVTVSTQNDTATTTLEVQS